MPIERDALQVFEACVDIELTMAKIYSVYENVFADDPSIALLWRKTAGEEENHAHQFRLLTRMRGDLKVSAKVDMARVRQVLEGLRGVLRRVETDPPSLSEALRSSIEIEKKLSDFHVSCLADFQEESHRAMFEAMLEADEKHVETLERAYRRLQRQGTE